VAPRTPDQPRPIEDSGKKKGPGDLLASTDQFRLDVQANPTVPLLTIDAQAPSAAQAEKLANAAVSGLGDFMSRVAASDQGSANHEVRLRRLGTTKGTVINHGVRLQVAFAVFLVVFLFACAASVLIARVRRGWQLAGAVAP
jgi:hypothetical protein